MELTRIGHIGINTSDFSKSLRFYTEILGLRQLQTVELSGFSITYLELPDGMLLELFDYGLRSLKAAADQKMTGYRHIAFQTADVSKWADLLTRHQIEIIMPVTVMPELGITGLLCRDPDGIEIEIFEKIRT